MNSSYNSGNGLPPNLHLADHQVQVWLAGLDCPPEKLTYYQSLLSSDESARSARFFFERDRNSYIAGRGLLRHILGAYLHMPPGQIEFSYGKQRKPAINARLDGKNLEFNLSHSSGLGVFAFCLGKPLGIDVERMRLMQYADRLAEQFFSPSEIDWLAAHSGAEKQAGFFKIWTCKEAFFKANGDGLTAPISQAVIDLESQASPCLAAIDGSQEQARRWKILSFEPANGYQAALAIEAQDWKISIRKI